MGQSQSNWGDLFAAQARNPSGAPSECLVIAEVAQAHDGSLGIAHSFIDAIADAGANAVKFQTHIASAESTPAEPWRVAFSRQDATRYDYWRRMEFSETHWRGLRDHAVERGLVFLSSPFSTEAIRLLARIGVGAWKVASGEMCQPQMIDEMIRSPLPVILSTGMSGWMEIEAAVSRVRAAGLPFAVLQCTSAYPCPEERIGLNVIDEIRRRFGCAAGLSDHSGTVFPCLAAAALGATVLEVHVTFSRRMFGPDAKASLTIEELSHLVTGVRSTSRMLASPVDKDAAARELAPLRATFGKSVVAACDLQAGTVLCSEHLALKKPGTGIPGLRLNELVGRRLRRNLQPDDQLKDTDVE